MHEFMPLFECEYAREVWAVAGLRSYISAKTSKAETVPQLFLAC